MVLQIISADQQASMIPGLLLLRLTQVLCVDAVGYCA